MATEQRTSLDFGDVPIVVSTVLWHPGAASFFLKDFFGDCNR
jgi:hypothetical protein